MVKGGDVHILCYYLFSVLLFYLFYYAVVVFLKAISGEEICVFAFQNERYICVMACVR